VTLRAGDHDDGSPAARLARRAVAPAPPAGRLLQPHEPAPFTLVNAEATTPLLLVCDHASNAIPQALGRLGLQPADLERHIAYDIGAAALTRLLAGHLDATAVLAGYSRLVIDCNRQPGDPHSILAKSDGTPIPGNANLSDEAQAARAEAVHWPYHHAIDQTFARLRRLGREPLFFSIHTFTPSLGGEDRRWDAGVLWNRDPRLAVPLLRVLREGRDLLIGDNEPYSGREIAYTLNLHAGAAGLPHAAIEVRQDHCEDVSDLARWAARLAAALKGILAMPHIHRVEFF
jgi:predicted N-formylglutamate amidohydrolase